MTQEDLDTLRQKPSQANKSFISRNKKDLFIEQSSIFIGHLLDFIMEYHQ